MLRNKDTTCISISQVFFDILNFINTEGEKAHDNNTTEGMRGEREVTLAVVNY